MALPSILPYRGTQRDNVRHSLLSCHIPSESFNSLPPFLERKLVELFHRYLCLFYITRVAGDAAVRMPGAATSAETRRDARACENYSQKNMGMLG